MASEPTNLLRAVRPWLPRTGSLHAALVAGALIGAGILARLVLNLVTEAALPPYLTLYPAIVLAAFIGGIRIGIGAVIVSGAFAWTLLIAPEPLPPTPIRVLTMLVYLFTASVTVLTAGGARLLLDEVVGLEAQRARTARESVHRIKNLLAVVQSLSRQIAGDAKKVIDYRDRLDMRLRALAAAQDLLLKQEWSDVPLQQVLQTTLGPFLPDARIELRRNAELTLPSAAVTGLSMALYELATNATKYGALARPDGLVRLEWHAEAGRCFLEWREVGAEHVSMGEPGGFGASLIRSALEALPESQVRYAVTPQGVTCAFEWDAPSGEAA